MTRPLTVTFVLPRQSATPIGGYRVVYEYADYFARQGCRVSILYSHQLYRPERTRRSALKERLVAGATPSRTPRPVGWHNLDPRVAEVAVKRADRWHAPDADIVVATAWNTAPLVHALAARKGKKFYLVQHFEDWSGEKDDVEATWRLPFRIVAISRWLLQIGRDLGARDIRHIPNGINLDLFRVTKPVEARRFGIATLYSPQAFKGCADSLAVVSRYHAIHPDVPVTMFGTVPRAADIPPWITYVENPTQQQLVDSIYNESLVYLGASLAEGWSLPPAEAMACGCAFVGTDIGGLRDYAIPGDTALLSPPQDRDALLRNLLAVTESRALLDRVRVRGHEAIKHFTWTRAGDALHSYFRDALAE